MNERLEWLLNSDDDSAITIREIFRTGSIIIVVGLILLAFTGIWPPFVAVESSSMNPEIHTGDLILVVESGTHIPTDADTNNDGIITRMEGDENGYTSFGQPGQVIVFSSGGDGTSIIHRAHFSVEAGENWYDKANPEYVRGDNCEEAPFCPAPYDAIFTKGDNPATNSMYDQMYGVEPVKHEWVKATAKYRIPFMGYFRLLLG